MPLYTFFLEYRGGTYIAQARGPSPAAAVKAWGKQLAHTNIPGLGVKSKAKLVQKLLDDSETPVDQVKNTWCRAALVRGYTALLHYTQTDSR